MLLNETFFASLIAVFGDRSAFFYWEIAVAVLSAAALGTVWLGGVGETAPDEETETRERTAAAFRIFSEIVSALIAARDARKTDRENAERSENSNATPDVVDSDDPGALNSVDFWREDYWNYDFGLDREEIRSEDDTDEENSDFDKRNSQNASKDDGASSSAADSYPVRNDRDAREGLDPTPEETESRRRSGNYFGAFFAKRNRDDSSKDDANSNVSDRSGDARPSAADSATPRWKRTKPTAPPKDEPRRRDDKNAESNAKSTDETDWDSDVSRRCAPFDAIGEKPTSTSRSAFDVDPIDEDPARPLRPDESPDDPNSDDATEIEFDYWEDDASWDDGPNEKFLDDETVSDDEKLAYLRGRIADGDDASREELARLLVQIAAGAGRDAREKALAALDEAEEIATEAAENGDEERLEFLGQVLLQRPLFYLRNDLEPPQATANDALARIRAWADDATNPDARRLLATAWQTQGNCLVVNGCEAAAVASLQNAVDAFEALVGEGATDAEPSLGYASAALGETFLRIGDSPRSIDAFRRAIAAFDKFSAQEPFLAEKVNVLFRLSVALRQNGEEGAAEAVLHEAVDAEERLLSFDEEDYIAPLTQLLNVQADFYVRRGAFEDAFVALDGAISALKRFLACDVVLSSRVRAYLLLEGTLRKRAAIGLWTERYSAAIRDVEEALEYLELATKKEENFEPITQLVSFSGLLYDCGAGRGDWAFVAEAQERVEELISRLTPAELKTVAPLYGQLLLQRHVALAKEGRIGDALDATNRAISALETGLVDDGELEYRVLLAKAFFQRGVFSVEIREDFNAALADFIRTRKLYEEARIDGELDESSTTFYLETLARQAFIEIKTGDFDGARNDLRAGINEALQLLRQKKWSRVDELESLSRTSVLWAQLARGDERALRVIRVWTRYWRRFRRFFIESSWNVERAAGETTPEETTEIRQTTAKIEGAIADLRRIRAEILEPLDWKDEWARYFDFADAELKSKTRSNATDVASNADVATFDVKNSTPPSFRAVVARAIRSCRDVFSTRKRRATRSQNAIESALDASGSSFDSLEKFDLDAARRRFEAEVLTGSPKNRALFGDRLFCLRVVGRRVEQGNLSLVNLLYRQLDKLTDLYLEIDDFRLSAAETLETTRLFETLEPWLRAQNASNSTSSRSPSAPQSSDPSAVGATATETPIFSGPIIADDATFFAELFPFWELQTAFLSQLTTRRPLQNGPARGFDVDLTDRTFRTTLEIARRSGAFDDEAASTWGENSSSPEILAAASRFRFVGTLAAYFGWLLKIGRVDDGLALLRREEPRLLTRLAQFERKENQRREEQKNYENREIGENNEESAIKGDDFERAATTAFYLGVGRAALENGLLDEANRALLKAEELLKEEERRGGDPSVWERQGNVQRQLARAAALQGKRDQMESRFRAAFDYYWRYLEKGSFDEDVFQSFVQIALFFLEEDPGEGGETAFSRTRLLAETATQNWNEKTKKETASAFWRLKIAAAEYCAKPKPNAAETKFQRRRSFYFLKRLYREANELLATPELSDVPNQLIGNAKFEEGLFWLRAGFLSTGRRAFENAIERWQKALADAESGAQTDLESEVDGLRRNVFVAQFYVATSFSHEKEFRSAREIFATILPETRRLASQAVRTLNAAALKARKIPFLRLEKRTPLDDRPKIDDAVNLLKFAFVVERGAAELEADDGFPKAARLRCRRVARLARKHFGKNSETARYGTLYEAYSALKGTNYCLALKLAKRYLDESEKLPFDEDGSPIAYFCAALKIRATAFLERGRFGDLERADRELARAFEILRDEFSRGAFDLRGFFAETLFVQARLETRRESLADARASALRACRILKTLVRRGQEYRRLILRDEIEKTLQTLAALKSNRVSSDATAFENALKKEAETIETAPQIAPKNENRQRPTVC